MCGHKNLCLGLFGFCTKKTQTQISLKFPKWESLVKHYDLINFFNFWFHKSSNFFGEKIHVPLKTPFLVFSEKFLISFDFILDHNYRNFLHKDFTYVCKLHMVTFFYDHINQKKQKKGWVCVCMGLWATHFQHHNLQ
jgi:hypothetical protein